MPADVNLNVNIDKKGDGDKEAAAGLEVLAKAADNAQDQLKQLDRQLLETRAAMIGAGKTFQQTGDISPLKSLLKDERQLSTAQKAISRGVDAIAKDLVKSGESGGINFVKGLTSKIQSGLSNIPAVAPAGLGQWLALGIAAAAPIIGAATGAAITLGVGGGALVTGIIAASHDPKVSAAWGQMFQNAGDQLKAQSSIFVEPLTTAATTVGQAFDRIIPRIGTQFALLAPTINNLATGAAGLLDNIFQGKNFDRVVALAGKLFDQLAAELPNIGNAISDMLGSVAAGGPGIQQFWADFLSATEKTVVGIGNVVEALSKTYEFLGGSKSIGARVNDAFDQASVAVDHFFKSLNDNIGGRLNNQFDEAWHIDRTGSKKQEINGLSDAAKQLQAAEEAAAAAAAAHTAALNNLGLNAKLSSDDFSKLSSQINASDTSVSTLAGAMSDKLLNSMLAGDQATLAFASSLNRVSESVKTNGHEIDINTVKGEANRQAVLGSVQANIAQYDWMIKAGAGAADAAASYDQNTAALEKQMRQAGFTQAQIDNLIGKYRGVPKTVDTNIVLQGLTAAISGLDETLRLINGLPSRKDISVVTHFQTVGSAPALNGPAVKGFARGGITAAATGLITSSPTILFGERGTGQEAYIPKLGITSARGLSLADQAARWHGGRVVANGSGYGGVSAGGSRSSMVTVALTIDATPGTLEHAVLTAIRASVVNAGGNVQSALGQRGH